MTGQFQMTLRFAPLGLIFLAILCVVAAAFQPSSRFKGRTRLLGSLCVGAALCLGPLPQIIKSGRLWPGILGVIFGIFLGWLGLRKYRRDPEGHTLAAAIL
ncbi:hypothetical protein HNQ77_001410 [Silvibacterium bohemicum]|uniref:Uncharacterized protein n=1 Tax=Silvibacterium bohemicum TaxID=1577686 RepID=A0A841JQ52_9BACT|nr:hypothetical protein [Silvibacterium bohemicum]